MLALLIGIDGQRLEKLRRLFEQQDIPVIRFPDQKERPDLYYANDGHWNAQGHLLAAELILQELQRTP